MKSLIEVLTAADRKFRERGIPSPRLDAELLLGHVLKLSRLQLYLNHDRPLLESELEQLRTVVRRRSAREPLAWIIGEKGFYEHDFIVMPGVLCPRPDTETLVEAALEWIGPEATFVADIGSGSGCIGLSLALERPELKLFAVDMATEALSCTKANVEKHGLTGRVAVLKGHLLAGIPASRQVDWVVSNPPYIPTADIQELAPEVQLEPKLALDGGADGLNVYRELIPAAAKRARKGVLVEVGAGQAEAVAALMAQAGLQDISVVKDMGRIERVVRGRVVAA